MDTLSARNLQNLLHKHIPVLLVILEQDLGPILLGQLPLLLCTRRRNRARTHGLEKLTQPQSNTARGSRDKDPVALLHSVRVADQRQRCERLQGRRSACFRRDGIRQRDDVVSCHGRILCVRQLAHVGDARADGQVCGHVCAGGYDGAGAFAAEDVGE